MDTTSAFKLTDRVAIVTGAGSGIGRACAQVLSGAGAKVVCADINTESAAVTAELISEEGGTAVPAELDVVSQNSVNDAFGLAVKEFGRLDTAINNAGIMHYQPVLDVSESDFDRVMNVNLRGVFFGCQAAARLMSSGGSIVNMASTIIDRLRDQATTYAASKGGVVQVTRTFAFELGEKGIRVNALAPGWVETGLTARLFSDDEGSVDEAKRDQVLEDRASRSMLRTVGTPEDIAYTALFLASDAARFVTGQTLRVNGGISMV